MSSFRVIKTENNEPQYCDYIQQKIEIGKKYGAVYDLNDEDLRIQKLYNRQDLRTEEVIKNIARVKSAEDGKEYLVVSKDVNFYNKETGAYVDRYSTKEGVYEVPIKVTNDLGDVISNQTRLKYTIPFESGTIDEIIENSDNGDVVPLQFYEGNATSNRTIRNKTTVGNLDLFKEATWTELKLAKEQRTVSSMTNNLDQLREINENKIGLKKKSTMPKITERKLSAPYEGAQPEQPINTNQFVEQRPEGIPTQVVANQEEVYSYQAPEPIPSTVISTNTSKIKLNTEQNKNGSINQKTSSSEKENSISSRTQEKEKEETTRRIEEKESSSSKINSNNNTSKPLSTDKNDNAGSNTNKSANSSNNDSKQSNK